MKKNILALSFICLTFNLAISQEVEIKSNKVLLDNKEILKYEKSDLYNHSFYSLNNDDEILYFKFDNNETPTYMEDDFFILNFLTEKKKIESKNTSKIISGLGINSKKNMEKLIGWLLKEKVLNNDGTINSERLETFYEKYNENIINRTIRN